MARFHITKKGEPGVCTAQFTCPLGGQDEHYASKEEAQGAYEAKMVAELVPAGVSRDTLGTSQLSNLAKVTSDPEMISEIIDRGSDRALRNLLKNPNVTEDQLVQAYNADRASAATQAAISDHDRFPASAMAVNEWADHLRNAGHRRAREAALLNSDALTDAHMDELAQHGFKTAGLAPSTISIKPVLANPYNQLSEAKLVELAEQDPYNLAAAMRSGRYPAARIAGLSDRNVYWGNIYNSDNPAYLAGYASWAAARKADDEYKAQETARFVADNAETPASALQELAQNDLALVEVYRNPRATDEVRALCEFKDAEVGRVAKIDRLQEQFGGRLREEIVYMERTDQPYAARGLYDTRVRFNTERMAELGLDGDDIHTLMGRGKYNGGARFDAQTGIFTGTVDSTD